MSRAYFKHVTSKETFINRQCSGKTGEEPPRVVNPGQGLELNITNQFETYFIADFNVTNFSNDYGDITHFAIWVREIDDQENIENLPTKPGKTPKRWSSVRFYLNVKWTLIKVDSVFPMVIWPEFRMGQYREDDHGEDGHLFITLFPFYHAKS